MSKAQAKKITVKQAQRPRGGVRTGVKAGHIGQFNFKVEIEGVTQGS